MSRNRPVVAVPTTAALPHSLRLPRDDPSVLRKINRLPREALFTIILDWLDEKSQPLCRPCLAEDEGDGDEDDADDAFSPATSVEELREQYLHMQRLNKTTRKQLVERVIYGDWVRVSFFYADSAVAACCVLA
jgi:central kinetochore subunit Mis15/CHL4